jgi:integrase
MASFKIRHLVAKKNTDGTARHYWQPSAELRAAGWKPRRLAQDQATAIDQAEALNADVDAWRRGDVAPSAPATVKARGKKHAPGTVSALIADYKASRFWSKLAAATTRRSYEWALDAIEAWAGDQPARGITAPAVQAFYEAQLRRVEQHGRKRVVVETPAKAAAAVRVLRLLLQVGVRLGYLGSNPASRPGISLTRKRDPRPWSPDQVRHMAAVADRLGWRSIGTAMLLNEWIGQREGDVLTLPPFRVEAEALVIRQGKTKRVVALPVHQVPHLVARLRAEAERDGAVLSPTHLLLNDRTGQPWNEHTFRHTFADIRAAAVTGLPATADQPAIDPMPSCADLRFMELRHTAVTRLHEAGVDYLGISGITGHTPGTVQAMCDKHYLVRTAKAAEGAFRKRLAAEGGEG